VNFSNSIESLQKSLRTLPERGLAQPQVHLVRSTEGRMWLGCCCALLVIIQSSITDSCASLILALAATVAGGLTELLSDFKRGKKSILDGSALASSLVFTLLLPNEISPVFAVLGMIFAMGVVKRSFGGLGANWLNPALGGWLFLRLGWPGLFRETLDGSLLSRLYAGMARGEGGGTTPWELLGLTVTEGETSAVGTLTAFLNNRVFSLLQVEVPEGYMGLFFYSGPGIIADRGILALLGGILLIAAASIFRWWIPLLFLAAYGVGVRLFGALPLGGDLGEGDLFFSLFSGGTFAAAFLLATDPATGAKSRRGSCALAFCGGVLAFGFRYAGGEPYGAFVAVLLFNALTPLVRGLESGFLYFLYSQPREEFFSPFFPRFRFLKFPAFFGPRRKAAAAADEMPEIPEIPEV